MKKLLMLVIIMMVCAIPATALANGPGPSPNNNYLLIDDYSQVESAAIWGHDKFNTYSLIQEITYPVETKVANQRIEFFYNNNGRYKDFQLVITFISGEKVRSNFIDIVEWGNYIYSVKDNTLKEGKITTWKPHGFSIFFGAIMLLFPLLFTVLVEWLVSLAFRLKQGKYVVIINFISNPVMNILLMLIFVNVVIDFYVTLIILEALVAGAEFWYYTRKYKGYTKKRLLLFTITANLASWFLYWYMSPLLR